MNKNKFEELKVDGSTDTIPSAFGINEKRADEIIDKMHNVFNDLIKDDDGFSFLGLVQKSIDLAEKEAINDNEYFFIISMTMRMFGNQEILNS